MSDSHAFTAAPQRWLVILAALFIAFTAAAAGSLTSRGAVLLMIGTGMGVTLYHAAFGFTAAYRRLILGRDLSALTAQFVMIAVASALFAPALAGGEAFGRPVWGAVAPVNVSMAVGACLFGIGMQLGGGCASGTLFTVGGGNARMLVVLALFCAGGFMATFHFPWWRSLPSAGSIVLADLLGTYPAVLAQIAVLLALLGVLLAAGYRHRASVWPGWQTIDLTTALRGPWPLLPAALLLALLNWATLVVAGHPWSITWAFTLWAAKLAALLGWDPAGAAFWASGFPARALAGPLLADTTTVMNIGIVLGAMLAAALAGRFRPSPRISLGAALSAALGGFLLGYGARLAYGCNIGALFSGIASTSAHGWVWLGAALVGNAIGLGVSRWVVAARHRGERTPG